MRTVRRLVWCAAFGCLALLTAWTACTLVSQPQADDAVQYVSRLRFIRHANGLCFGVVQFDTYYGYRGVSITAVPAEACRGER